MLHAAVLTYEPRCVSTGVKLVRLFIEVTTALLTGLEVCSKGRKWHLVPKAWLEGTVREIIGPRGRTCCYSLSKVHIYIHITRFVLLSNLGQRSFSLKWVVGNIEMPPIKVLRVSNLEGLVVEGTAIPLSPPRFREHHRRGAMWEPEDREECCSLDNTWLLHTWAPSSSGYLNKTCTKSNQLKNFSMMRLQ